MLSMLQSSRDLLHTPYNKKLFEIQSRAAEHTLRHVPQKKDRQALSFDISFRESVDTFTLLVLGIDNRIYLQVWVSKCPVHTAAYSSVSNTVCMKVQWESYHFLTWQESNRAASSSVRSSLTDSSNIWVRSRAFESHAEHQTDGIGSGGD